MPFPLNRDTVRATETRLGIVFPEGFVSRMVVANGGDVDVDGETWSLIPFLDDSDPKRLARTCNDIVRETQEALKWPNFPRYGVAIASNGCGDLLVRMPSSDGGRLSDVVYMWSHESGELDTIADDFAELV